MLWALAQRYTDMEKSRKEGHEEGRERVLRDLVARGVELPPDILKGLNAPTQNMKRFHKDKDVP